MAKSSLYVIQVRGGTEERMRDRLLSAMPQTIEDCFIPEYETMWATHGVWKPTRAKLFPGYVFVQTSDPKNLVSKLASIPAFTRLLGINGEKIIPLTEDEIAWMSVFTTADSHLVKMSQGIIEGDRVIVTEGPLRGHEAEIAKVDRHKRIAVLNVRMFNQVKQVRVGLAIVWKKK